MEGSQQHHKPAQGCIHKANILRQEGFTHRHRGVAVLEHQYIAAREVMGGGVCRAGDNRAVDGQANVLCPIQDSICVIKGRPGGARIFLERVAPNASTRHIPPRQIIIEEFTCGSQCSSCKMPSSQGIIMSSGLSCPQAKKTSRSDRGPKGR